MTSVTDNNHTNEVAHHQASLGDVIPFFLDPKSGIKHFPVDKYSEVNNSNEYDTVKIIHFVRHGQGYHNLRAYTMGTGCTCDNKNSNIECPYVSGEVLDALLTDKGKEEAGKLFSYLEEHSDIKIDLILSSPLSRAIQTSLIGLNHERFRNTKRLSLDIIREQYGVHTCDQRRAKSWLETQYPTFDYSSLSTLDEIDQNVRETKKHVSQRINQFYENIKEFPENNIAVFSHSSFLFTMIGEWLNTGELRSFVIAWKKN